MVPIWGLCNIKCFSCEQYHTILTHASISTGRVDDLNPGVNGRGSGWLDRGDIMSHGWIFGTDTETKQFFSAFSLFQQPCYHKLYFVLYSLCFSINICYFLKVMSIDIKMREILNRASLIGPQWAMIIVSPDNTSPVTVGRVEDLTPYIDGVEAVDE